VDLDGRRLIHAEHLVSIEVGLLHTAVLERDLTIERGRDAEDDRALNLSLDCVGIDDGASASAATSPIPDVPPVMTTTLSFMSNLAW
jgi:hypothetical protein